MKGSTEQLRWLWGSQLAQSAPLEERPQCLLQVTLGDETISRMAWDPWAVTVCRGKDRLGFRCVVSSCPRYSDLGVCVLFPVLDMKLLEGADPVCPPRTS